MYFSAFAYSYNLIKDNWLRTLDNGVRLFFKVIFFLIVAIIISIIGVFMKNEIVYSIGILISNIIYFAYGFLFLIFTINYFLYLEKEKGISNELFGSLNENNFSKPIFPNEQQAKNYILEYKSQFSRESIKIGLKNVGMLDSEIDIYLNKYL